jgi:hypothetical protein
LDDLSKADLNDLYKCLQHDSLLERFAYRRQAGTLGANKEFIKLKGTKGQIDHGKEKSNIEVENADIGFKCLHYSVTESNGTVEITIVKKVAKDLTLGFRTVPDTAVSPKDYQHCEEIFTLSKKETELKIQIPIVDDEEWEPDLDFFVELFDPNKLDASGKPEKLYGDDTRCKVTILDEDFPGTLGFELTDVRVSKNADKVEITIMRLEGADGIISCMFKTEPLSETPNPNNAEEYEDYLPSHSKITFLHGENEKTISIGLVKKNEKEIDTKGLIEKGDDQNGESSEEKCDVMFKVRLEKPEPEGVKISKKNVCIVTIVAAEDADE